MERGHAFSILELLAVISLIIIMLGIAFGIADGIRQTAAHSRVCAELASLAQALEEYKIYYGDYPWIDGNDPLDNAILFYAALNGTWRWDREAQIFVNSSKGKFFIEGTKYSLQNPDVMTALRPDPNGDRVIIDPWENAYYYLYKNTLDQGLSWERAGFLLISRGPDSKMGSSIPANGILDTNYFNRDTGNADNLIYGY